ncbi:MAG: hypothetical protein A2Y17_12465 [Clostridiales bacterium GWF2_38_85]|nr:MAG: hypothetical protein A2Y17_12465 [Clostridiales bacterium GWF2_38_85]
MKNFKKMAVCMLIFSLLITATGCAKKATVLEYSGSKMDSGMFSYALSENKSYQLYNITGANTDNPELWVYEISDGKTYAEYFMESFIENCKLMLISDAECKRLGIEISEEQAANVQEIIDAGIEEQSSLAKLNVYLASYGINTDVFKEYLNLTTRFSDLVDYYYGESGIEKFSEQDYIDYLKDNYTLVQHILYMTTKTVDDESGAESEVDMTDEEKTALHDEIQAKVDLINSGEKTYEDYIDENQDSNVDYLVNESSSFVQEFLDAALDMEIGEVRIVETTYGYHVMRKIDITSEKYAELYSDVLGYNYSIVSTNRTYLEQESLYNKLSEHLDDVIVNDDEIAKFDVITAPIVE